MSNPDADLYRRRFFVLQALRLAGAVLGFLGLAIIAGKITGRHGGPVSPVIGYVVLAVGLVDVMLVPSLMIRAWRREK